MPCLFLYPLIYLPVYLLKYISIDSLYHFVEPDAYARNRITLAILSQIAVRFCLVSRNIVVGRFHPPLCYDFESRLAEWSFVVDVNSRINPLLGKWKQLSSLVSRVDFPFNDCFYDIGGSRRRDSYFFLGTYVNIQDFAKEWQMAHYKRHAYTSLQ